MVLLNAALADASAVFKWTRPLVLHALLVRDPKIKSAAAAAAAGSDSAWRVTVAVRVAQHLVAERREQHRGALQPTYVSS